MNVGADLVSVYCAEEAAIPLKSYSPELMVTPIYAAKSIKADMSKEEVSRIAVEAAHVVSKALPRSHAMVIGPGLGRSAVAGELARHVIEEAKNKHVP